MTTLILFHGTSYAAYQSIIHKGVVPRGSGRPGNFSHTTMSHERAVYLTDTYPLYFAAGVATDGVGAVLEIDTTVLDQGRLRADEDVVEQLAAGRDGLPSSWSLEQRVEHYRDRLEQSDITWRESLCEMGTCCYMGVIPPEAIQRVAIIDFAKMPAIDLAARDMSVSRTNFRFCSFDHRCLTAWVFGDPDPDLSSTEAAMSFMKFPGFVPAYRQYDREGITIVENIKKGA